MAISPYKSKFSETEETEEAEDTKINNKEAEKILEVLETQSFRNFYEGKFDKYITGEDEKISRDEILQSVVKVFKLDV